MAKGVGTCGSVQLSLSGRLRGTPEREGQAFARGAGRIDSSTLRWRKRTGMDPLTESARPVRLPRPLSDPLRRYRWLILLLVLPSTVFGLLLPNVQKVREAAARASTQNNTKQIGSALQNYHDRQGVLPPGVTADRMPPGVMPPDADANNFEPTPRVTVDPAADVPAVDPPGRNRFEPRWPQIDLAGSLVCAASFTLL